MPRTCPEIVQIRQDVFPEQRGHPTFVGRCEEDVAGVGVVDHVLDHQGVDVDQRRTARSVPARRPGWRPFPRVLP